MKLQNVWRNTHQRALVIGLSFLLIGVLAEYLVILILNSGHFMYTLDDPYIHLALAENIADGHYGINQHEFSSPASSILWPFMLAPFAHTGIGEYIPFLLNIISAILTVVVFWKGLCKIIVVEERKRTLMIAAGLILLILGSNMIALIFTGMEHSFQVLCVVLIVWGLIVFTESQQVKPWLMFAILIAPLVRYENLAVSLAALLCLFWQRYYKLSILFTTAVILSIGSFSLFLITLGLEPFPTSVLVKSSVVSSRGHIEVLLNNFYRSITQIKGFFLFVEMLLLLVFAVMSKGRRGKKIFAVSISVAIMLHLFVGGYGWYNRYEIYIWTVAVVTFLYLGQDMTSTLIRNPNMVKIAQGAFMMLFAIASSSYLSSLVTTPIASNNLYEQHYQMRRLAMSYNNPIAVNDIGFISYRNDHYILDLWGLASLDALHHRRNGDHCDWMNQLAIPHNVQFAMIYESWFQELPANWQKVGELHLGKKNITLGHNVVAFYGLNDTSYQKIYKLLRDFQGKLPGRARITFAQ